MQCQSLLILQWCTNTDALALTLTAMTTTMAFTMPLQSWSFAIKDSVFVDNDALDVR